MFCIRHIVTYICFMYMSTAPDLYPYLHPLPLRDELPIAAPCRLAPSRFTPDRLAPHSSVFSRVSPIMLECERSVPERLAPAMSASSMADRSEEQPSELTSPMRI